MNDACMFKLYWWGPEKWWLPPFKAFRFVWSLCVNLLETTLHDNYKEEAGYHCSLDGYCYFSFSFSFVCLFIWCYTYCVLCFFIMLNIHCMSSWYVLPHNTWYSIKISIVLKCQSVWSHNLFLVTYLCWNVLQFNIDHFL